MKHIDRKNINRKYIVLYSMARWGLEMDSMIPGMSEWYDDCSNIGHAKLPWLYMYIHIYWGRGHGAADGAVQSVHHLLDTG